MSLEKNKDKNVDQISQRNDREKRERRREEKKGRRRDIEWEGEIREIKRERQREVKGIESTVKTDLIQIEIKQLYNNKF